MLEKFAAPFLSSFGGGLGKTLAGGGAPLLPNNATSGASGNVLDGAGFVVNFRGQQIASASPTSSMANPFPGAAAAGLNGGAVLAVLAFGGLLFWLRKRKGR